MRVRRSFDNKELDIGYTDNNCLDIAKLLSFASDENVFVCRVYDQVEVKDLVFSVANDQPLIVEKGKYLPDANLLGNLEPRFMY